MNVLFISHYAELYGANRSLLNLIDGLKGYGVKSHVFLPQAGPMISELERREIPYKVVEFSTWINNGARIYSTLKHLKNNILRAFECKRIFTEWEINLVYTNSSVTPFGAFLAIITRTPHFWHIRELITLHYGYKFDFCEWLVAKFMGSSKVVICNSHAVKKHYFGDTNGNVHVVYNGVTDRIHFETYKSKYLNKKKNEEYTFAIVGTLSPQKKQDMAIRALAKIVEQGAKAKLLVLGDGKEEYKEYLLNLVMDLNLGKYVDFLGYINDPYEVYLRTDCLLICSEHEAMGRVVVEAMSACLPVIGRQSGGIPELIQHNETGFLFSDLNELGSLMLALLEDPIWGQVLGQNAWSNAIERYTVESYAKAIYTIIKNQGIYNFLERSDNLAET